MVPEFGTEPLNPAKFNTTNDGGTIRSLCPIQQIGYKVVRGMLEYLQVEGETLNAFCIEHVYKVQRENTFSGLLW